MVLVRDQSRSNILGTLPLGEATIKEVINYPVVALLPPHNIRLSRTMTVGVDINAPASFIFYTNLLSASAAFDSTW